MGNYVSRIWTVCLSLVMILMLPQVVKADNGDASVWRLTAEAKAVTDEEGTIVPAIVLSIVDCNLQPDFVEFYRTELGGSEYSWIGRYVSSEASGDYVFCDRTAVPQITYDYCAVIGWYDTRSKEPKIGGMSNNVSCKVELARPELEVQSSEAKGLKILLPASGFVEEYSYAPTAGDGIYATGIQIYRSRKEDSGYKLIATVPSDEAFYQDAAVTKGKLYFYKARTYYYDKETKTTYTGAFSEIRMGVLGAKNFPDADSLNWTVTRKSPTTAKISWDHLDGFAVETLCYSIRKEGDEADGRWEFVDLSKKAANCMLKDLEEGCAYEIRLQVRVKTPYNDGNDNFYYDSRWYVSELAD